MAKLLGNDLTRKLAEVLGLDLHPVTNIGIETPVNGVVQAVVYLHLDHAKMAAVGQVLTEAAIRLDEQMNKEVA